MTIVKQRVTADVEGDFVVFIIGMRINRPWKLHKWLPVFASMPRMLAELREHPESGFLGAEQFVFGRAPTLIQYWRSFEDLEAYAQARDNKHWPAWTNFNKRVGSKGDVGIWHETYRVAAGAYECVYNNMPPTGLAGATKTVPAAGYRETAAGRFAAHTPEEQPAATRD
jgi:hypothetical protein